MFVLFHPPWLGQGGRRSNQIDANIVRNGFAVDAGSLQNK